MKTASQMFFLAPIVYFTDQKVVKYGHFLGLKQVCHRGYFHNAMRLRLESVHVKHVG